MQHFFDFFFPIPSLSTVPSTQVTVWAAWVGGGGLAGVLVVTVVRVIVLVVDIPHTKDDRGDMTHPMMEYLY